MHTTDPAYWAAKLDEAERRVRLAAKALARLTTPNGHPSTVPTGEGTARRKSDEYLAALHELLTATTAYQGTLHAMPLRYRPQRYAAPKGE